MSLSLMIVINTALDAALLGGLAWAMARPARMTPHRQQLTIARVHSRRRTPTVSAHGSSDWSVRRSRATA